ncbi:ribose-5-phosphate isomerase RpiA [Thiotrichales bacterium 19S11-10]|nr:ribose-5-phosphate isomerase RpiA [Thiotrichales bacterium 19S11-10]MCF6807669.1 ribose-5-phosphate isomerase RpiA [Thiotrichales bacterium 19S9-11]MCF6811638.1 ribose-5-phosphate isomerase RpiA [Thiotrichales bacterium 19S9-12]
MFRIKLKMDTNKLKQQAAEAAIGWIRPDITIGVGTGSTVHYFIEALVSVKHKINQIVSSSEETTKKLKAHGFYVSDLNSIDMLDLYVDGADECNHQKMLIKGGGGALTREKILAVSAKEFLCIIDQTKYVELLGSFPLPIEVIPMARGLVARAIRQLGGQPVLREDFITDNGNIILDIHNLDLTDPKMAEAVLTQLTGVVCCGLFSHRGADTVLMATESGTIETI